MFTVFFYQSTRSSAVDNATLAQTFTAEVNRMHSLQRMKHISLKSKMNMMCIMSETSRGENMGNKKILNYMNIVHCILLLCIVVWLVVTDYTYFICLQIWMCNRNNVFGTYKHLISTHSWSICIPNSTGIVIHLKF